MQTVKEVITKAPVKQEIFLERLEALRTRIEKWCSEFGYDNQDNYAETKNDEGEIVWFKSDWDYVDGMHNTVYNSRITQGAILLCTVDNLFQDFKIEGNELIMYQNLFLGRLKKFNELKNLY